LKRQILLLSIVTFILFITIVIVQLEYHHLAYATVQTQDPSCIYGCRDGYNDGNIINSDNITKTFDPGISDDHAEEYTNCYTDGFISSCTVTIGSKELCEAAVR
jgi:hypothetical protein